MTSPAARSRLFWLALMQAAILSAQGAVPADSIDDGTRVLTPAGRAGLADAISAFDSAMPFRLGILTTTFVPTNINLRLHAAALRRDWERESGADWVIVAHDRASNSHALSFTPELWDRYSPAEIVALMRRCVELTSDSKTPLEERIAKSAQLAMSRLRELEAERTRTLEPLPKAHQKLAIWFVVTTGVGGLFSFVFALTRRRRESEAGHLLFPKVFVGQRFGAPNGGGVIVEIDGRMQS